MARDTNIELRNTLIYQVYVRNHTEEGTFKALIKDLDRIKALGTDIVYLLPIHPIGEKSRKGELGSPYSIKDYYAINPELGTEDDFRELIDAVHQKDMRIMMDIVFNHTSYDSVLFNKHPEFFYKKDGQYTNRVGDWWDIVDFDFTKDRKLWDYLIDNLVHYTKMGVDGFRFDVSSLIPYVFMNEARETVKKINPDTVWLSESVHGHFLKEIRDRGFDGLSESELYGIFDMAYDYDAHPYLEAYLENRGPLSDYVFWHQKQEEIYPKNYIKMRNLENHDFGRFAGLVESQDKLENWHAFSFFAKGSTMIFGGGEASEPHHPDLFNKDTIAFSGKDISPLITAMRKVTDDRLFYAGVYAIDQPASLEAIRCTYTLDGRLAIGIFNVGGDEGPVDVALEDGEYTNRIDGNTVHVKRGQILLQSGPIVLISEN